ncbi:MAG: competence protein CoiA, partial [Pirellulaceae bacterium]
MKYANVNELRQLPEPLLRGNCPSCGAVMIAKCGESRIWHWAHKGNRHCDDWWENETAWHRAWKDCFPAHWQEVVETAPSGERHIADVKTDRGWVLEIQHSYLRPEERRSRDAFYQKLIWIVDARRRKRDLEQLNAAWMNGRPVGGNQTLRKVPTDNCVLLREWVQSESAVFFDTGDAETVVWRLAKSSDGGSFVALFSRPMLIQILQGTTSNATDQFNAFLAE